MISVTNRFNHGLSTAIIALSFVVAGCGGDPYDPTINPGSGGTGSGEPIHSRGTVASTEPLRVNETGYETAQARVVDDQNQLLSQDAIKKGMVIEVDGIVNNEGSSASVVRLRSLARGWISTTLQSGFIVNGLPVRIDSATQIDAGATIATGVPVEVFGLIDRNTSVALATHIRSFSEGTLKITGSIDLVDSDSGRLVINGIEVQAPLSLLNGVEVPLQTGSRVVVLAELPAGPASASVVRIDAEAGKLPPFGIVSMEGIVGRFGSLADFELNGATIDAGSSTILGSPGLSIEAGWRVQVRGRVTQQDKLRADTVTVISTDPGVNIQVSGSN